MQGQGASASHIYMPGCPTLQASLNDARHASTWAFTSALLSCRPPDPRSSASQTGHLFLAASAAGHGRCTFGNKVLMSTPAWFTTGQFHSLDVWVPINPKQTPTPCELTPTTVLTMRCGAVPADPSGAAPHPRRLLQPLLSLHPLGAGRPRQQHVTGQNPRQRALASVEGQPPFRRGRCLGLMRSGGYAGESPTAAAAAITSVAHHDFIGA